ncbi:MAG: hypothetical protein RIR39_1571 [Pseudomonadota bacterium]|jgi:uncharacterized protein (DUF2235 family)
MSKNIVVLSDGTGQDGGVGNNTNIYKLFNLLEDRTQRQVVFYDPGLGTNWRKLSGNLFGMGISENILQCYRFIFDNYEAGDKIYLFGFSRGAATVRSLSGFIHEFGILPQSRPELIKKAYAIYEDMNGKDFSNGPEGATVQTSPAEAFVSKHHTMWANIEFIGCFDTVAALGMSQLPIVDKIIDKIPAFKHDFHNFKLSPSVIRAYHALAIDDERKTFFPILWTGQDENKKQAGQRVTQVWFCGMHTDVGGGYKEQNLSDIPLVWMLEKATKYGLLLYIPNDPKKIHINIAEDADGVMHNSRAGGFNHLYRQETRHWDGEGLPWVHQSVLDRANNTANNYHPWILERYKIKDQDYRVVPWVRYDQMLKNMPQ